jgi:hypothetical protein
MFNVRSERAVIVAVLAVASQALSSFAGETVASSKNLIDHNLHHLHELAYIAIMNFSLISSEPMLLRAQMLADISVIMDGAAAVHSITSSPSLA